MRLKGDAWHVGPHMTMRLQRQQKIAGGDYSAWLVAEINTDRKIKSQKTKMNKSADGRKQLSNMQVIRRNLVYVVGFSFDLTDEELFQKKEYFGQYGKVLKVSMSRTTAGVIQLFPNNCCNVFQAQILTMVEYLLLLYRALLPEPLWYRFFLNKEYGSLFSSLMTGLYLTFELTSIVEKVQYFLASIKAFSRKEIHSGAHTTLEQLVALASTYSVAYLAHLLLCCLLYPVGKTNVCDMLDNLIYIAYDDFSYPFSIR